MVNCFSCVTIIFAHQMASTPFINTFGVVFNDGKTYEKCALDLGFTPLEMLNFLVPVSILLCKVKIYLIF